MLRSSYQFRSRQWELERHSGCKLICSIPISSLPPLPAQLLCPCSLSGSLPSSWPILCSCKTLRPENFCFPPHFPLFLLPCCAPGHGTVTLKCSHIIYLEMMWQCRLLPISTGATGQDSLIENRAKLLQPFAKGQTSSYPGKVIGSVLNFTTTQKTWLYRKCSSGLELQLLDILLL